MKKILLTLMMALAFSFAYAEEPGRGWDGWIERSGNPLPDTNARKSSQGFGAILVLVNDPQFFKRWNTPSETFEYTTMESVKKGEYFVVSVIFINPGTNEYNNTHITFDAKITTPSGSIYANVPGLNGWNREAPQKNILGLSEGYLAVKMEPEDEYGTYKVEAVVHDKIKNVSLNLYREFALEK